MKWEAVRERWRIMFGGSVDLFWGDTAEDVALLWARVNFTRTARVRRIDGDRGGNGSFEVIGRGGSQLAVCDVLRLEGPAT